MSMDRSNEPASGTTRLQRRFGIWLIAAIAFAAIAIAAFQGQLAAAIAIAAAAVVIAAARYFGRPEPQAVDRPIETGSLLASTGGASRNELIAALPDPTVLLDPDGRVLAMNASASAIAPALRRGELASLALRLPDVVEAMRRAAQSRKLERVEFVERTPAERWFEVIVTPLQHENAADKRAGLLLTFRDLTPMRRLEEMRVDFVANASHELRTPLAALSGFIETLKGPARNDVAARERFLDIMEAQAKRMARLIDDLLSLSRIELAAHVRPQNPVELYPVVRQVADALQMLARERGVTVTVDEPAEPLVVSGDRDELTRVFENLVENALKYGASGKRVEITLSRAPSANGDEAVVTVRDYGPGIPPEHLPRLTERFYRVDVTESRAQGGTGLGLALVKHIMNRHRGRLTIESRPGQGATFTIRMPLSTVAQHKNS
jgi:two-component system phosphate regulon sensor histidine kinase PhoR